MKRLLSLLSVTALLIVLSIGHAVAQASDQTANACPGPIYETSEVNRRARIIHYGDIQMTEEARAHDVHGQIILTAILCRTGQVTDVKVIKGLPYGMTERAVQAARALKFTPAEKNWHTVSIRTRFEFGINDFGVEEITAAEATGRTVEAVQIIGNRRLSAKQILGWVHTRPGEIFDSDQIARDLDAIRASGYFDTHQTRALVESGVREGVTVTFGVVELSTITEVRFENLEQIDPAVILAALQKEGVDLRIGTPYKPESGKEAIRVLKQVLQSNGQPDANVELQIESVTASSVKLTFVVH